MDSLIAESNIRMNKAIIALKEELASLRTGRASTSFIENIIVQSYGVPMPLNQVATLSVPEPRMISIQPWDKGMVKVIEKAILESHLGLNPIADGFLVRVPLPELTEERRKDLVKVVLKYSEQAKVAIRNVRRDFVELARKSEKNKEISQDEMRTLEKKLQDLTDSHIVEVDALVEKKKLDIMQV
ncbi:MAG: ribosome recycling factor [Magnetococcus sp. DMHC-6]